MHSTLNGLRLGTISWLLIAFNFLKLYWIPYREHIGDISLVFFASGLISKKNPLLLINSGVYVSFKMGILIVNHADSFSPVLQ